MTEKAKILFVDDEKRVLNSMRALFRRNYELFLTTRGKEAVNLVRDNGIDVIVADQRMPGMDGVEVLSAVKEVSPRTVRVLLTGYADPEAIQGSINMGEVFRFLSKPCPPKLLRETLDSAIAASRASAAEAAPAAAADPLESTAGVRPAGPEVDEPPGNAERGTAAAPAAADTPPTGQEGDETDINPVLPQHETSTELVMSGDAVREVGTSAPLPGAGLDLQEIGVAVFTINSEFAEAALLAASRSRKVTLATSLVKVAEILEKRHAGVLVTDFTSDIALLQNMIGMLKRNLPELVTIVISDCRDTSDMINLINYGQIFRYGAKPVGEEQLRKDIAAAVIKHVEFLEHPELLKRHEVLEQRPGSESSPILKQFMSTVRKLGGRSAAPAGRTD